MEEMIPRETPMAKRGGNRALLKNSNIVIRCRAKHKDNSKVAGAILRGNIRKLEGKVKGPGEISIVNNDYERNLANSTDARFLRVVGIPAFVHIFLFVVLLRNSFLGEVLI